MKTLTVATLKGGNAKTTTSLAIAAVLAEKGHPVALRGGRMIGKVMKGKGRRVTQPPGSREGVRLQPGPRR